MRRKAIFSYSHIDPIFNDYCLLVPVCFKFHHHGLTTHIICAVYADYVDNNSTGKHAGVSLNIEMEGPNDQSDSIINEGI